MPTYKELFQTLQNGLAFLESQQFPNREFRHTRRELLDSDHRRDIECPSPFPSALIIDCLSYLDCDQAREICERTAQFLETEALPNGTWAYWTKNSQMVQRMGQNWLPDCDTSSTVSYVLSKFGSAPNNKRALLNNRSPDGRFYTWIIPRWRWILWQPTQWISAVTESIKYNSIFRKYSSYMHRNDVEITVCANALLYLGQITETDDCRKYIERAVQEGNGIVKDSYYTDIKTLYFLSRLHHAHPGILKSESQMLINATRRIIAEHGKRLDTLEIAVAICTLINLNCYDEIIVALLEDIINRQDEDGGWPWSILDYNTKEQIAGFGSREIATAFCLQSIARCLKIQRYTFQNN